MASAATARTEALFERMAIVADRLSGYRLGEYAAASGYLRQSPSPYSGFGAAAAAGSLPLPIARTIRETAAFTVEEARERIAAFLDGRFVPDSINELIEYLGEQFLRLETRILPNGGVANYLVDTRTSQSVPAAQVDPKLGHAAITAARLRGALRQQVGPADPADVFHSWQGMALVLDNSRAGTGYTVEDGQAWYGKVHAVAGMDQEANARTVREARARGLKLVLPVSTDASGRRSLVPGMPILLRTSSLKAEAVHPGLSHARLSAAFGKGMPEAYASMAERARVPVAAMGSEKIVSMSDFRARFARTDAGDDAFPVQEHAGEGFGGLIPEGGTRDLVIRPAMDGSESLRVYDRQFGEEAPISVRALPAGRYERLDEQGARCGHAVVSPEGRVKLYGTDGLPEAAPRPARQAPEPAEPEHRLPVPGVRTFH